MFLFLRYAYIYLQLCAHYDVKNQVQIRKNRQQSLKISPFVVRYLSIFHFYHLFHIPLYIVSLQFTMIDREKNSG